MSLAPVIHCTFPIVLPKIPTLGTVKCHNPSCGRQLHSSAMACPHCSLPTEIGRRTTARQEATLKCRGCGMRLRIRDHLATSYTFGSFEGTSTAHQVWDYYYRACSSCGHASPLKHFSIKYGPTAFFLTSIVFAFVGWMVNGNEDRVAKGMPSGKTLLIVAGVSLVLNIVLSIRKSSIGELAQK